MVAQGCECLLGLGWRVVVNSQLVGPDGIAYLPRLLGLRMFTYLVNLRLGTIALGEVPWVYGLRTPTGGQSPLSSRL